MFGVERNIIFLNQLSELIKGRKESTAGIPTQQKLFQLSVDRIIQKVGEETIETIIAAKNRDKISYQRNLRPDIPFTCYIGRAGN